MSFTSVTLTGQVQDVSGNNVAAATVIATLSNEISDGVKHVIPSPISCLCDDDGNLSLKVLANDDETTLPTGTYYNFQVKGQGITASFSAIVPSASAPSVDLFSLAQLNTQPTPATTYVESVGGLNGVVGFTSPNSSVTIGTDGNNVTLEAAGSEGDVVTSVEGLNGAITFSSPDSSVTISTSSGTNVTLEAAGSGSGVTSVTAGNGTITVGGTEDAPTVKVTADTFDAYGAASTAQTNAETFATSAVGTETSRAEAAEALLVASVTAGNGTITVGGTDTAPTIEVTADTYDAYGAASTAQTAAESFATSAVATETSRAETAEATAQSNAESFATSAVATETSRAETAEATAQSNAETFATSAASTAQSNAETFATSAVGSETSRAEAAEGALVSSVTAGNGTITVGGTATAPTIEVTSGTYDASGAAAAAQSAAETYASSQAGNAQSNAETFATSAVATETSRAEAAEALLAPANDVVTSIKGLQGVVGITSPDSSVTIGTSGNNITLEAGGSSNPISGLLERAYVR